MRCPTLAGIFVGGASLRMGGEPKGLLRLSSGETVVDRWCRVFAEMGVESVLVGSRSEYGARPTIADARTGVGPLGGLLSLLERASAVPKTSENGWVIAVACDMPHVSPALLSRLLEAPDACAVAPRRGGRWEPMLARYDASGTLEVAAQRAARGEFSMQGLLDALSATELLLSPIEERELDDWDTLADVRRRPG